jgi:hypothetical protein
VKAWKSAEARAAKALGGKRHVRATLLERAPDVDGVEGWTVESKHRKRLPQLVTGALAQASGYAILDARPVAVLHEHGSRRAIACLWLDDFAALLADARRKPQEARSPSDVAKLAQPAPVAVAPLLAEDEGRFGEVLARAFARLEAGRAVYGAFNVETDSRDLRAEAEEELLDAVVYSYLAILKLRAGRTAA